MTRKPFDFKRYPKRRIALLFLYMGWEFDGFVAQAHNDNTIEEHILRALLKTKLIDSREECQWTRCGRTDKGVSAFRQVAALTVRSTDVTSEGHFWPEGSAEPDQRITSTSELPYIKILNAVLPRTVRILAYAPVQRNFSARFNCVERVYTYLFPRASIKDITCLNDACARLCGTHDFRNFCHIDRNKNRLEMSYIRTINFAKVEILKRECLGTSFNGMHSSAAENKFDLFKLTIKANGFLWHQIRCIVSLLWEIGCGNEQPEIIDELFDIVKFPARPQYKMTSELPLCLFDCTYPEGTLEWVFDRDSLCSVIGTLQALWTEHQIKAANIKSMLDALNTLDVSTNSNNYKMEIVSGLDEFMRSGPTPKNHIPIWKRPCCDGLDERRKKNMFKKLRKEDGNY